MDKNVCNICGSNYVSRNGRWVCEVCGAFKPEEINNEEQTLVYQAEEQIRLGNFDDAEAIFTHVIELYPDNSQGYWGLLRAQYGIKYERDYNGKAIPTCFNASYESFFDNPNYAKALEKADSDAKEYYRREADRIEAIRREWVEKAEKEPVYDVFLSYKDTEFGPDGTKTDDYNRVYEIYNHLTYLGYSVFFARKSLSDKAGEKNYEPYIFRALNTAPVMVVYASKPEYVRATWVKNEWSRFLKRIERGEKESNALAVAFSGFDASLLPKPLDSIQNFDATSLTFIKELERYIEAVVTKSKMALPKITRISISADSGAKAKSLRGSKLRKAGGRAPIKKAEANSASIQARQFGLDRVPSLAGDVENRLLAAEEYVKQRRYKEANEILDPILSRDKRNGRALYLRMLAASESDCLDSFIRKIDSFVDLNLLTSVIDYGERSSSENLLARLSEEAQRLFESGKYDASLRLYHQIASYDSSSVKSLNRLIAEGALGKLKSAKSNADKTVLLEHLDISLSCLRADEAAYKETLQKAIQFTLELKQSENAGKYLCEYERTFGEDSFFLVQGFVRDSSAVNFEAALKDAGGDAVEKLTQVLNSMPEKDGNDLLDRVADIACSFVASCDYGAASKWSKFLSPYEFARRREFVSSALSSLISSASPESHSLFKQLLAFYGAGEEAVFLTAYEKYADALRSKGLFAAARDAYEGLIEYAPKSERVLFHRLLAVCECAKDDEFKAHVGFLSTEKDFAPVEAYLSCDSDKESFLRRLNALSSAAMASFLDNGRTDALAVFERLSSYYPSASDEKLASDFLKLADATKNKGLFDYAAKYYSLSLSLGGPSHIAYWGLLQSRLNCKTDAELIKCPTPMADLPEFDSAIAAAGRDKSAVSHYIECRIKQEEEIAKRKKRKKIKKNATVWGGVLAFVAIIAVTLSLLAKNVFIPNSIYENGVSLINKGNYQEALDTLNGLGYSDSDSQVLVAKAGLAFEEGDYETGISRIHDAGGTVEISYDPDGGTTTHGANAKQSLRRSAYVTAAADKPGYTFVEWKQDSFSIATSKQKYSAEVGLKASYEIVTYHISYDLGGGSLDNPVSEYTVLAEDFTIGTPSKRGYTFAGWSGSGFDGTQMTVTITTGSVGDKTFVAHWIANEYLITYDYGFGEKGSQAVTYDQNYELEEPTRPGYAFKGWKNGNETFTGGKWQGLNNIELSANWEIIEYNITYGLDGGTNNAANPNQYTVEDEISLNEPTKTGYSFLGWSGTLSSDAKKDMRIAKGTTGDLYFEAHWSANEYLITYDYGFGDNGSQKVTYDDAYELETPERPGYEFLGWKRGDEDFNSGTWDIDDDVRLVAQWAILTYSISYDLDGGVNSEQNPVSYNEESEDISLEEPTKVGHTFIGWTGDGYAEPTKEVVITKGTTGNRTFVAHWVPNEYEITYDYGYGNKTDTQQVTYGDNYDLIEPNRDGYDFLGWYEGGSKEQNGTWQRASDATLVAQWSIINYDIVYELDGGTNHPSNPSKYTVESPEIALFAPTKTGYDFLGWTRNDHDAPAEVLTIPSGSTGNAAFKAHWKPREYSLSLDYQGGSSSYTEKKVAFDSEFTLPCDSTKQGYTFAGWFDVKTGQQILATTWTWANDLSIFAKWNPISYQITYVLNGGTNSISNPSTYTIESDEITIANPEKPGYTFKGWDDGSGEAAYSPVIASGSTGNRQFEATWSANENTIVFHGNGATSGEMASAYGNTDQTVVLPENGFAKTGYQFVGWAISADGAVVYSDQGEIYIGTDPAINLYAVWEANVNTVTFHANGGNGNMSAQEIHTYEAKQLNPNSFARDGYHFVGWADSSDGPVVYGDGAFYTMGSASNYDLYAKWEPNGYTVYLDPTGGNLSSTTSIVKYEADYKLPVPVKFGYSFIGWFDGTSEDSLQYTDGKGMSLNPWHIASDGFVLCAKWGPSEEMQVFEYTISHNDVKITGIKDNTVTKIVVPGYVTEIAQGAFKDCSNLEEITLPFIGRSKDATGNEAVLGYIFDYTIVSKTNSGVVTSQPGNYNKQGFNLGGISSIDNVPTGTTLQYAYLYLTGQKYYAGSETLYQLGYKGCCYYIPQTLKNITVTNCETVPEAAFLNCSMLESITLEGDNISIDKYAFYHCDSLQSLTIDSLNAPIINDSSFYEFNDDGWVTLYVPESMIATYESDDRYSKFTRIIKIISCFAQMC